MSSNRGKRKEGGPRVTTPGNRPTEELVASATTVTASIVLRAGDQTPGKRERHGRVTVAPYPTGFASVYEPGGRRHLWAFAYVCPHCGLGHLGRADSEQAIKGRRHRGSCGRVVIVKVARTYRGRRIEAEVVGQ